MRFLKFEVVVVLLAVALSFAQSSSGPAASNSKQSTPPAGVQQNPGQEMNAFNQFLLQQLPVSSRNFSQFTLLTPGVGDAQTLTGTGSADLRVASTPQTAFSFNGNNGRMSSLAVDGSEAHSAYGAMHLTLGQEAIQEFNVQGGNYSAFNGASTGSALQVIGKSGSNQIHGSAFGLFGFDALNARNPFAYGTAVQPGLAPNTFYDPAQPDVQSAPVKPNFNQQQFGGSVGFAIKPDKTFGFVSFDGFHATGQVFSPTLTNTALFRPTAAQNPIIAGLAAEGATPVPCLTGQPALPANTCAGILTNILTIDPASSPLNQFLVTQFQQNSGLFNFADSNYQASGRVDHTFNDQNKFFFRYSFARALDQSPDVAGFTTFAAGNQVKNLDHTLQAVWTRQINSNVANELRLEGNYTNFNLTSNDPGVVGLDILGYASLGSNLNSPAYSLYRHYGASDSLTWVRGNHQFTFGGDFGFYGQRDVAMSMFPGRFVFSEELGGILSPCLQVPAACGVTANPATISSLQSASLGLPQFYEQGFSNDPGLGFNNPSIAYSTASGAGFAQDSWKIRPNLTLEFGARYEVQGRHTPLQADNSNIAPRVSFSWSPKADSKTVIRGGYGMFYSPLFAQAQYLAEALGSINGTTQVPVVQIPLTGIPGNPAVTSAAVFQTLFAQGKVQGCTFAGSSCITSLDLTQFGINVSQTTPVPGAAVLFGAQPTMHNPYSQQGTFGIQREFGEGFVVSGTFVHVHTIHLPQSVDTNLLPAPAVATGPTGAQIPNWAVCGSACFVDPNVVQNNVLTSTGRANYDAGIFELNKRFSRHFSLLAKYTYSKASDNVSDYNSDLSAFNQTNVNSDYSVSNFNQTHKVVFAAVVQSPWQDNSHLASRILSGFVVSPIVRGSSGHPFNALVGFDLNGDRNYFTDRPAGAGRNSGTGPSFWTADLRLSREFNMPKETKLQFMAEVFNLTNRANYSGVNNFVGNAAGPFNYTGASGSAISQPLAFTQAYPSRSLQLGMRVDF